MKPHKLFLLFSLQILLIGCISEFNADLPANDVEILVVEGDIIGNSTQYFYLKKTFPLSDTVTNNDLRYPNIEAVVRLTGNDGTNIKARDLGQGKYELIISSLDEDAEYSLEIEYNGETYKTTPSKPLVTPEIDSVSFLQKEEYGDVAIRVSTHSDTDNARYYIWNYEEDWEITAAYYAECYIDMQTSKFYLLDTAPYYYCWCNNKINSILIESTDAQKKNAIINKTLYTVEAADSRFSNLYSVNVKQRALSGAAYEYYRSKLTANEQMGGLFTPQPTEPNGNIKCTSNPSLKALGYVEVLKNITEKRLFVDRSSVSRLSRSTCVLYEHSEILSWKSESALETLAATAFVYQVSPVFADWPLQPDDPIVPTYWASNRCVDCRENGGSKNRPSFWPDNGHY